MDSKLKRDMVLYDSQGFPLYHFSRVAVMIIPAYCPAGHRARPVLAPVTARRNFKFSRPTTHMPLTTTYGLVKDSPPPLPLSGITENHLEFRIAPSS